MTPSPTWLEIDLNAIRTNVRHLRHLAGTAGLLAVVKANAYGHGAVAVSRAAAEAGAAWLGVARAGEGLELRAAGLALPILVMGYTPPAAAAEAIANDLTLTVYDLEIAAAYAAAAREQGRTARVHVKLDSGMGRLGIAAEDGLAFVRALSALPGLSLDGLFTHFAGSDLADQSSTLKQLERLDAALAALTAVGLRPPRVHAANSGAVLRRPEARYDLVRSGILLYGLDPSDEVPRPAGFEPALTWKATLAQVKTLPPGHGVSYGAEYVTTETETVAVLPVGYADGFRRVPKRINSVLIAGQRAPVRGRVCMDQIVVGVSHLPGVRVGDEAVLVGRQGSETISAEMLAQRWGTINYDVTSGILARVERRYLG
ncbi:MAG: alanine racemase [Anaerolineales bacterium]